MFESFDVVRWSFCKSFDRSIIAVANVANNLMTCCRALRKESIADTLNITSYQKLSRYARHHHYLKQSLSLPSLKPQRRRDRGVTQRRAEGYRHFRMRPSLP